MMEIGIDIVEIKRFDTLKKRSNFLNRVYNEDELLYLKKRKYNTSTVAGIFAAKEAMAKSMGIGIGSIALTDLEVKYQKGKPYGRYGHHRFFLSISHDNNTAVAVALFSPNQRMKNPSIILPYRDLNSHKGNYGKVGILGGSRGMVGSVYLSAQGALRSGSGLVYNLCPKSIADILQIKSIENIIYPLNEKDGHISLDALYQIQEYSRDFDALGLGCGMGVYEEGYELIHNLLHIVRKPMVIDADGLHLLSKDPEILKLHDKLVLTPHLKEFSRLIKKDIHEIEKKSLEYAMEFAKEYGVILVLKGHSSIVTNGDEYYINNTGNPGMATAGSGDVLTGIITSLLGQGYDAFIAAKFGVYFHGFAGDMAKEIYGEEGLLASDILPYIGKAMDRHKKREDN